MTERDATIALNLVPGIGPMRVHQLLAVLPSTAAILNADAAALARVPGVGSELAKRIATTDHQRALDDELSVTERAGVRIVARQDSEYPPSLLELRDPPLCLYLRGDPGTLASMTHAIAVVGSRRTTRYGIRMAKHVAGGAAFAGWTVVAGLARGIDTAAHEAALDAEGCTVAVLGSGLGRVYPRENIDLARRMVDNGGALVSEFPMMFPPDRRTFPMRNRIIAGMTRGTVVVEAGLKSGSLITATQALEQGRQVFAVPGPVDSPQSRGCHRLLKDGAALAENFADVVDGLMLLFPGGALEPHPSSSSPSESAAPDNDGAAPELDGIQRSVFEWIGNEDVAVDDIVAGLNEPSAKVLSAIVRLEMRRLVRQLPGKRVCRVRNAQLG